MKYFINKIKISISNWIYNQLVALSHHGIPSIPLRSAKLQWWPARCVSSPEQPARSSLLAYPRSCMRVVRCITLLAWDLCQETNLQKGCPISPFDRLALPQSSHLLSPHVSSVALSEGPTFCLHLTFLAPPQGV